MVVPWSKDVPKNLNCTIFAIRAKKSLIFAKSKSFNLAVPEKYVCKKIFGKNVAKNKKFHTDLKKSFKFAKNYSYWQYRKHIFAKRFLPKILQKLAKI